MEKQKLIGIYNMLMEIHTSGQDSYKMIACLNTLKEVIAAEEMPQHESKEGMQE